MNVGTFLSFGRTVLIEIVAVMSTLADFWLVRAAAFLKSTLCARICQALLTVSNGSTTNASRESKRSVPTLRPMVI